MSRAVCCKPETSATNTTNSEQRSGVNRRRLQKKATANGKTGERLLLVRDLGRRPISAMSTESLFVGQTTRAGDSQTLGSSRRDGNSSGDSRDIFLTKLRSSINRFEAEAKAEVERVDTSSTKSSSKQTEEDNQIKLSCNHSKTQGKSEEQENINHLASIKSELRSCNGTNRESGGERKRMTVRGMRLRRKKTEARKRSASGSGQWIPKSEIMLLAKPTQVNRWQKQVEVIREEPEEEEGEEEQEVIDRLTAAGATSNCLRFLTTFMLIGALMLVSAQLSVASRSAKSGDFPRSTHLAPSWVALGRHIRSSSSDEKTEVGGGCSHKPLALWTYLHSTYPELSAHLLELATGQRERGLLVHSIVDHLLAEAERRLSSGNGDTTGSGSGRQAATGSSWLARVSQNPIYGKIVQLFRNQQLSRQRAAIASRIQQQQQQHNEPEEDASRGSFRLLDGHSDSKQRHSVVDEQPPTYGRVIHYPHEALADPQLSQSTARQTLQKLRHLSQQSAAAAAAQADASGAHKPPTESADNEQVDIESNRIPSLAAADGDGQPWTNQRERDPPAADKEKYVYGSLVHSPSQKWAAEQAQRNHKPRPMGTLRQLSDDLQANEPGRHKAAAAAGSDTSGTDSYGRLLDSPTTGSGSGDSRTQAAAADGARWPQQSTLSRLRQQLEPVAAYLAEDELSQQQQKNGGSVALHSMAEDFEGQFHENPVDHIEVRQIRSRDTNNLNGIQKREEMVVVHTTSSPGDVILVD